MAFVPIVDQKPFAKISARTVSVELRHVLHEFFRHATPDSWLVGGTALAGFYAAHRVSHDMDVFVKSAEDFDLACRIIKDLQRQGLTLAHELHTPQYYRTQAVWQDYAFTVDLVLDENIHQTGQALRTVDGITIPTLNTLFAMKFSTLVSRCSEKDLFDLKWFFTEFPKISMSDAISNASLIDGGLNHEALLISLSLAQPRAEACGFLPDDSVPKRKTILQDLMKFRRRLIRMIRADQKTGPRDPAAVKIGKAVRILKKLKTYPA